eukprot:TRINITY_DN81876_c0_g1_i1.p1 TRINITY_DN81876_c0_g1~~TRINITY_DN81876_c0_g1_i1.p1  ORF type:complete len:558 (+),score=132.86 TRINITY_DN81876_c0_g1_i1:81-1754(+)
MATGPEGAEASQGGGDADTSSPDRPAGCIREGLAEVLPNKSDTPKKGAKPEKENVFYNPAQVFNRDLSIVVLSVFAKIRHVEVLEKHKKREQRAVETGKEPRKPPRSGMKVLEALAATGIRSIRYAKELGHGEHGIHSIVANDLDPAAVELMKKNLVHNKVKEGMIEASCGDANVHMYTRRARGPNGTGDEAYDVIDLDPYGTCAPFLDAAVQAVADGGLLCITSTDMPVLGGNHPETAFAKYGGTAMKASYLHEMSLRIVLHAVTSAAAKYGRDIVPVMSCSLDFYVRVFVRVYDSPARAKHHASKTSIVHQCMQCESFFVQPLGEVETPSDGSTTKFKPARVVVPGASCPECEGRFKLAGPFYSGSMYDSDFLAKVIEACDESNWSALPGVTSWKKVKGLATAMSEEHADLCLHYKLPSLFKVLKASPMPLRQFRGTLQSLGYKVSHFHREPEAVKTDAPNAIIFDLMRLWAEENPPKNPTVPNLLKKELTLKRPIEWKNEVVEPKAKVPRFLPNPEKNWGPKARARGDGPAAAAKTSEKADATPPAQAEKTAST